MAQKENQRITLTKKLLQEGLLRLLETKPLARISVTELCKESGINRATFYNHYNSPLDLMNDLEKHIADDFGRIIGIPKSETDIVDSANRLCHYFKDHSREILILNNCHADQQLTDRLYRLNIDFHHSRLSMLGKVGEDDAITHLTSIFFYNGFYQLLLEWVRRDIDKTPEEIATLILRFGREDFLL